MIPLNGFTSMPIPALFSAPLSDTYTAMRMRVMGGVAVGDSSQGRLFQVWNISYDGVNAVVTPETTGAVVKVPISGATSLCLAFDSNMAVAIGYTRGTVVGIYYFDSSLNRYNTLELAGGTSGRVAVDNPAAFFSGPSDIIFGYTVSNVLYWRQQRDRYAIERVIGATRPNSTLVGVGLSGVNRLQFQLQVL